MKNRKRMLLMAAVVLAVGSIAGCGSSSGSSASTTAAAAAETTAAAGDTETSAETETQASGGSEVIKIGLGAPLTGTNASYGELMRDGAQLAIDEINEAGGVNGKMLELVAMDDKDDPNEAALVAQRFCDNEDIVAVISHGNSTNTLAAAPIYEAAKMPNISPSSNNATLTELGYEYYLRASIRDDRQSPQVVAMLVNNLGLKKIAVIYANNDYGVGNLEAAQEAASQLGAEVVAAETYNPGLEKDFSTMISRLQREGAEGVALYADHTDAGLILSQAHSLGLDIPFVGQSALTYQQLIDLAGADALQDLYICVTFNPFSDRELVTEFMDMFLEIRPGEVPSEPCAGCYDIVHIIAQALSEGAEKENLAQWIKNYDGLHDDYEFTISTTLTDDLVWDHYGDVQPIGVSLLKVSEEGTFVNYDETVDISGLSGFNIVSE